MIEYIKLSCGSHFGACGSIEMRIKNNKLEYEYYYHKNCFGDVTEENKAIIIDDKFIETVERLNLYDCYDEYRYEDYFVMDGWSFDLEYKECGKDEKGITGQYFPDEIKKLIREIRKLIPYVKFPNQ